jgi:AmiR/NasT family two-component response regulator
MSQSLRIALAEDEYDTREYMREALTRQGHQVVAAAGARQLIELCRIAPPDLIVTDIRLPDGDGIDASKVVSREREVPAILVTGCHSAEVLARAEADHVMAYLVKPVSDVDLEAAVQVAMLRFRQFREAREEVELLRQSLDDRKSIERARGVIMRRLGLEENEAFRRLRKLASDHNRKIVLVAQEVLASDEVFHSLEKL